jgi:excisionase family DNA binding protein
MNLLTVKQLAVLLNIKVKTIYDWVYKNKIPHYKLEGCLRFNEEEILKWLKGQYHDSYRQS